jgi:hypothetical protein
VVATGEEEEEKGRRTRSGLSKSRSSAAATMFSTTNKEAKTFFRISSTSSTSPLLPTGFLPSCFPWFLERRTSLDPNGSCCRSRKCVSTRSAPTKLSSQTLETPFLSVFLCFSFCSFVLFLFCSLLCSFQIQKENCY